MPLESVILNDYDCQVGIIGSISREHMEMGYATHVPVQYSNGIRGL